MAERHAWVDGSAGIAGDMLLGALLDAGADLTAVQAAVDAVAPDSVAISTSVVTRAGQRGLRADVRVLVDDPPHRPWSRLRTQLEDAGLAEPVRRSALATFARLAAAEARVHQVPAADVHFHEVGALDSVADVVGVCAAVYDLRITTISAGPLAVGAGRVRTAHGDVAVPVPAVVELCLGWEVVAGGDGELSTPTGAALVTTLAERCESLPRLLLAAAGAGAGTRDVPDRANLTRVLVGERVRPGGVPADDLDPMVVLEANVDDLDPRVWPEVVGQLLAAGAADAWLVPIVMKKGRPAHTVAVLGRPDQAGVLRSVLLDQTSTLGVRQTAVRRFALPRGWVDVDVGGTPVAVKVGHRDGVLVRATPEFASVQVWAEARRVPLQQALIASAAAVAAAGLTVGSAVPVDLRGQP